MTRCCATADRRCRSDEENPHPTEKGEGKEAVRVTKLWSFFVLAPRSGERIEVRGFSLRQRCLTSSVRPYYGYANYGNLLRSQE